MQLLRKDLSVHTQVGCTYYLSDEKNETNSQICVESACGEAVTRKNAVGIAVPTEYGGQTVGF